MLNTKTGQSFVSGKALFEDVRRGIIDTVVQNGGARYLFSFFLEAATLCRKGIDFRDIRASRINFLPHHDDPSRQTMHFNGFPGRVRIDLTIPNNFKRYVKNVFRFKSQKIRTFSLSFL